MKKFIAFFLIIIAMFSLLIGCESLEILEPEQTLENDYGNLVIHFLDVGQADSILIQLPNGTVSLIDGGNREDSQQVIEYIKSLNINKIDYLIATHPHEDHIGGLPEVVKTFDIGNVYMPNKTASTKIFESLITEIKNKGLKVIEGKAGIDIISEQELKFTILAPNSSEYSETNDYSIVTKLEYKGTSFLFAGDAEKPSEYEMLEKGYDLAADVLKVGHHGGRTSTSEEFLNKVNPQYAVISVEKGNSYGHPHKETMDRLINKSVEILRTDEMGTIVIVSDGININIKGITSQNITKTDSNENIQKYIGNKNTKVYHSEDCNSLPNKENQIEFKSIYEAENAGYKPHSSCIGK